MEPITPFLDRVRELYDRRGLSTILVAGSSGAYFHPADHIIQMDRYVPRDVTDLAKKEAAAFPLRSDPLPPAEDPNFARRPKADPAYAQNDRVKVKSMGRDGVLLDRENIDLRYVEQLADGEQTAALGLCLVYARRRLFDGKRTLAQIAQALETLMDQKGLEALCPGRDSVPFLARPRQQEILACLNRWRGLRF